MFSDALLVGSQTIFTPHQGVGRVPACHHHAWPELPAHIPPHLRLRLHHHLRHLPLRRLNRMEPAEQRKHSPMPTAMQLRCRHCAYCRKQAHAGQSPQFMGIQRDHGIPCSPHSSPPQKAISIYDPTSPSALTRCFMRSKTPAPHKPIHAYGDTRHTRIRLSIL